MDKPFTTEELQNALKQQLQSNPNLSPGRDGFSLPFLKAILPQIEKQLVTTFNNLTTATDLPQQMKPVILKFIPKPGKPTNNINNYRPIALIPTISRLLSKIIANRLQPILDCIISQDQQGFIINRSLHYNYKDFNNSLPSKPPTSPTPYSNSISRRHLIESIINTCISNSQASTFLKALSTS
ncbi:unnamed protein product [Ambrosiozyma monospora]|uniref:Unnamed protein product n=1 Tax=Ambrosiozyma monospora TaxID=43982 RepID=A0ACB5UDN6_AMBMO|nr:unnamed protein product [Ambrosiozyma monospora]